MQQTRTNSAPKMPKRHVPLGYEAKELLGEIEDHVGMIGKQIASNIKNHLSAEEMLRNDAVSYHDICEIEKLIGKMRELKGG